MNDLIEEAKRNIEQCKKIENLHKALTKKDEKIARQAEQITLLLKQKEELKNRICKDCKYYEEYSSVCCNGDSPLCAGVVDLDFGCNKFEKKE